MQGEPSYADLEERQCFPGLQENPAGAFAQVFQPLPAERKRQIQAQSIPPQNRPTLVGLFVYLLRSCVGVAAAAPPLTHRPVAGEDFDGQPKGTPLTP